MSNTAAPIHRVFFFDPGGPGLSPGATMSDLLNRFPTLSEDGVLVVGVEPESAALPDKSECVYERSLNNCRTYFRDLLKVTTPETVHHIDAVRSALNIDRVSIIGFSYGSLIATQYARFYPKHTLSLVLDGVVSDRILANHQDNRPATARINDGMAAANLLDRRIKTECSNSTCSSSEIKQMWNETISNLQKRTYSRYGITVSYDSTINYMIKLLGDPGGQGLVDGIKSLYAAVVGGKNISGKIIEFSDMDPSYGLTRIPAQWTICSDSGALLSPEKVKKWSQNNFKKTAGFAPFFAQDSRVCGLLQASANPLSHQGLPLVPVLLFDAKNDVITSYGNANDVWAQVRYGRFVITEGSRHLSASSDVCSQRQFELFTQKPPVTRSRTSC